MGEGAEEGLHFYIATEVSHTLIPEDAAVGEGVEEGLHLGRPHKDKNIHGALEAALDQPQQADLGVAPQHLCGTRGFALLLCLGGSSSTLCIHASATHTVAALVHCYALEAAPLPSTSTPHTPATLHIRSASRNTCRAILVP